MDEVAKRIRVMWIIGLISIGLLLLVWMLGGAQFLGMSDVGMAAEVLVQGALVVGVMRKNRFAAAGLFGYFILSKLYMIVETHRIGGIFLTIVIGMAYYRGMMATFEYHQGGGDGASPVATPVVAGLVTDGANPYSPPGATLAGAAVATGSCPKCKAAVQPGSARCMSCGASLVR
jgi:hypothetical protein